MFKKEPNDSNNVSSVRRIQGSTSKLDAEKAKILRANNAYFTKRSRDLEPGLTRP